MKVKNEREVVQSCPTLSDPMDRSLPDSSIHGILQARILEWGAIAFSEYVHSAVFKMDNQQGPIVHHGEFCSMLCGSLDGRGVWGRMDTCICTPVSAVHLKSPHF